MNWNLVLKNRPSGGASARRIALTMPTYSRIWAIGLVIFESNQFSTVAWWETPRPRTIRPPDSSSIVAAACAVATGVRAKIGKTPVPRRARWLTDAYAASSVSASRPAIWVT